MTKNTPISKVFTRILGFQVGNKVGFVDWRNVPKYGTVVEVSRGLLWIRFYHDGLKFSAVRCEEDVELIE